MEQINIAVVVGGQLVSTALFIPCANRAFVTRLTNLEEDHKSGKE